MVRLTGVLALLLACLTAPAQAAVGFQRLQIPDPDGPPIEVGVWYPTAAAPTLDAPQVSPVPLAPNAPVQGTGLPLVVISHGTGASYASHADTAAALAQSGFVAAALTHTGDNWRDQSRRVRIWDRPRQLKLLTDYMLQTWPQHARIDPARIGAFGFSAGGFTVLAAAGGQPDLARIAPHCQAHPQGFECQIRDRDQVPRPDPLVFARDARLRALVVAAPALGYTFGAAGLAAVKQPVQLWRAGDDQVLPHPFYAEAVRAALPRAPEYHVVGNAGHLDFLAPCTPQIAARVPEICKSAPGFDRTAFHAQFNRDVVRFFEKALAK